MQQWLQKFPDPSFQGLAAQRQRIHILNPVPAHDKNGTGIFPEGIFYNYLIFGQGQILDRSGLRIIKGGVERLGLT